jgi:hypothetical protein
MWTRYLIKCNSCDKITNLRVQIPEVESLPIAFQCLNCTSEIKGLLTVDFQNFKWKFDVTRGTMTYGDPYSGDFYYEFSDTIATKKPSITPHSMLMPTMRMPMEEFEKLKLKKDLRKSSSNEQWENLKDLTRAYLRFDKKVIEKLVFAILGDVYPEEIFIYRIDLDYHRNYFLALNRLMAAWINFEDHAAYVDWLSANIFNELNFSSAETNRFIEDIFDVDVTEKIKIDIADLTRRFIDLREYFFYANGEQSKSGHYAAVNNFNLLKSFYTDCFEFVGRTSHYIFMLQNFSERGTLDSVPTGCPRNVTDGESLSQLNNGEKLSVINLSEDEILKAMYNDCFDSKLRNGINHFKARLDHDSQMIYYYPITKRPEEEYNIPYIDFLNKSLDLFNTVLKIGQLAKIVNVYRFAKDDSHS